MKAYNGFEAKKIATREQLPVGAYVCKILDVKLQEYSWGETIELSFDIAEGEHKDFYAKDYRANTNEDRKWRGKYRLNVPKDDGTEQDGWTKRSFENAIWAFEDSNTGFRWAWNESALKGKTIGLLFRNREWEFNGKTGWSPEAAAVASVSDVRSGNFKLPKDKPLKTRQTSSTAPVIDLLDDADLPF